MPCAPRVRPLLGPIVDALAIGIVTVSRDYTVLVWNRYLETHSGVPARDILGTSLFQWFPHLEEPWFKRKLNGVFLLRNNGYTSFRDRPWLFQFEASDMLTRRSAAMLQDCTFSPIMDPLGEVVAVTISVVDATETGDYQDRLERLNSELERKSERDALTRLYNHGSAETRLASLLNEPRALSVVISDVDHFKKVNDTYGHPAGDEVLREVARRLVGAVRDSDVVARWGGDEFIIFLPNASGQIAVQVTERMRGALAASPVVFEGTSIPITASFGVASKGPGRATAEELVAAADLALYRSKENGRDRVTLAA